MWPEQAAIVLSAVFLVLGVIYLFVEAIAGFYLLGLAIVLFLAGGALQFLRGIDGNLDEIRQTLDQHPRTPPQ